MSAVGRSSRVTSAWSALAIAVIGSGCAGASSASTSGGDGGSCGSFAEAAVASGSGADVTASLHTVDGASPGRGVDCVALDLTMGGAPRDGLTISVHPWMPAMGHGSSVVPTVTALGGGRYAVSELAMVMPGLWQLQLTVDGSGAGGVHDTLTLSFDVH